MSPRRSIGSRSDASGTRVQVRRSIALPDPARVERARRAPELGPRILFLSGGNALRPLSRVLKLYTHNSIHIVTPFDSGGSSAHLRRAFDMFSVGDLRNRLLALADERVLGNSPIFALFSHRLDTAADSTRLTARLAAMISGSDALVAAVPEPLRRFSRSQLALFAEHMPRDFDLRGASIGNLILAGGYLAERNLDAVLYLFSQLLAVRGTVVPVVESNVHLAAQLEDGTRVLGQHKITGKEHTPLASTIAELSLVSDLATGAPATAEAPEKVLALIRGADLIVYPMGSFFSSVLCNLLPAGVGQAIASAPCPKVFVPNTGHDPEQLGYDVGRAAEKLVVTLRRDAGPETPVADLMNFVLVDPRREAYALTPELDRVKQLGAEVALVELLAEGEESIDAQRLTELLLSLS